MMNDDDGDGSDKKKDINEQKKIQSLNECCIDVFSFVSFLVTVYSSSTSSKKKTCL